MSKRFMDTALWQKEWFMLLPPKNKCAVLYLFSHCDNVGVWCPNTKLADSMIGAKAGWDELPSLCNDNIKLLKNGKWFLVDFCDFQYGELNPSCKPHASYINLLKKHGLFESEEMYANEGYTKGIHTLKEKEKEKDKTEYALGVTLTKKEHEQLVKDYGREVAALAIDKLSVYKMSNGKIYKSDYGAMLNWVVEKVGGKDRGALKADQTIKREKEEACLKKAEGMKKENMGPHLSLEKTRELISTIAKKM